MTTVVPLLLLFALCQMIFMQVTETWIFRVDLAENPKIHKVNEI